VLPPDDCSSSGYAKDVNGLTWIWLGKATSFIVAKYIIEFKKENDLKQ